MRTYNNKLALYRSFVNVLVAAVFVSANSWSCCCTALALVPFSSTTTTTTTAATSKPGVPKRLWRKLRPKRYQEQLLLLQQEEEAVKAAAVPAPEETLEPQDLEETKNEKLVSYWPVFDFQHANSNGVLDEFERIDDVIMGGVSSSQLRLLQQEESQQTAASWSGVCRPDGGGFCGVRTRPWSQPLSIPEHIEGFYFDCKFTSDLEPERRVWKMVTRAEPSRGEQAYQASFTIPPRMMDREEEQKATKDDDWVRIQLPFSDFRQVRGARAIEDGIPLNVTATGLYQIGLVMSRFEFAQNMTELENFRAGYFELLLKSIGFYSVTSSPVQVEPVFMIDKMTSEEVSAQRPLALKAILPVFQLLFSEQSRRRKVAMKKLQQRWKMSRWEAMRFGFQWRRKSVGFVRTTRYLMSIIGADSIQTVVLFMGKWLVVNPVLLLFRSFKRLSTMRAPGL